MELTDEATKQFLEELDAIDKPITVVFYGDHLPGIYKTAGADEKNSIALHLTDYFIWSNHTVVFYGDHLPGIYKTAGADEKNSIALHLTDYFIWSNQASEVQGTKLGDSAYTSPNFFIAQAAEQMDAKVSPYLAFLTDMHAHIAAMEPPVVNTIQGWDRIPEGQAIYLNQQGEPMSVADMDAATKQLLEDYKLIQYDITAGDNYLKDMEFMAIYLNQQGEPMSVADMDAATKQLLEDYKLIQYDITAGDNYLKDMEFMALPK